MKWRVFLVTMSCILGLLLVGLFLATATPEAAAAPLAPQAPFWEETFSGALPPETYYVTATTGSGLVDNGSFLLTMADVDQRGRIFYLEQAPMATFEATFSLYLGDQDFDGGDGAAFIFCPSYDYEPAHGGWLDASCPDGYLVAFDTYEDGDPHVVYVAYEGTGFGSVLTWEETPVLDDGLWHEARVFFDQGTISVFLDGELLISPITIPDYEPFDGYFGFSAGTGMNWNEQRVDDILITLDDPGYLDGYVTDAVTTAPINGATMTAERADGYSWSARTDPTGYYTMSVPTGAYTVTADHSGYIADSASDVAVGSGATTTQAFALGPKLTVGPDALEAWLLPDTASFTHPTGLEIENHSSLDLAIRILEGAGGAISRVSRPLAAGGPDGFGYTYLDSNEPGGPLFEWIEIAPPAGGTGTASGLSPTDDEYVWPIALPFPFNFYGTDYAQLAFDSNGVVHFKDDYKDFESEPIPGDSDYDDVDTFIAPYWDDLRIFDGDVYYQDLGDGRFVVEYYKVAKCCSPDSDTGIWQVILYANGSILFQYLDASIGDGTYGNLATVGIQGDVLTGLQYSYHTPSLADGLAICFTYPDSAGCETENVPWLWAEPATGLISALYTETVDVLFTSVVDDPLPLGTYTATLRVVGNGFLSPVPPVGVTMHVVEAFADPVAAFEANAPVQSGEAVAFTNTSTEGMPPTAYYEWDFGDGATLITPAADPVQHSYARPGTYNVTLTAYQKQTGVQATYSETVVVEGGLLYLPMLQR